MTTATIAGRFVLEREAGSGGMGVVYLARDLASGAPVALKLLDPRAGYDRDRFARGAELLARLEHSAIVAYIAHGESDRGLYLAMEWLEGEDLGHRLARQGMTVSETIALSLRVARALAHAHGRGIVHRDIKPSNIFLRGSDLADPVLLDFGIARLESGGKTLTQTGVLLGTPQYMAPEQARGDREIDTRADVYGLGAVMFECATGRAPFRGEHLMAVLAKILFDEPPRMAELAAVPPGLDELCSRMLAKAPEARPGDAAQVVAALELLAGAGAPSGRRAPASGRQAAVLSGREQRFVSVVMAGAAWGEDEEEGEASTLAPGETRRDPSVSMGAAATVHAASDASREVEASLRVAVSHLGGRLERVAGGAFVVTLVGGGSATDQAARAALCALAVRAQLPGVPIALTSGKGVVAGQLPVGEVIDEAASLLRVAAGAAATAAAPIRIDHVTAGLLDIRFDVGADAHGLILRGQREVVETALSFMGRPSPCVGREREIGLIEVMLGECIGSARATAVLVTAPAGAGKSRLTWEILRRLRARAEPSVEVWVARADPIGAGAPLSMLAQVVRDTAHLRRAGPLRERQEKLRARLGRHLGGPDHERVTQFLAELCGAPFPESENLALRAARRDAMLMGDHMRRAFVDWVDAEAAAQPVVLVLEDLQWGDAATLGFVAAALRRSAERPLFVLALGRPEVRDLSTSRTEAPAFHEIPLGELPKKAAAELVGRALGSRATPETIEQIVDRGGGNPFLLEELVRAAAAGRVDRLPESVIAMVQTRLDALPADSRRLLRAASVYGQVFWRSAALTLVGMDRTGQVDHFRELERAESIALRDGSRFPGEDEFSFRHGTVREAAYAMLTDADRTLGHRLAADWLERAGETDVAVLAEHSERGGDRERAARWYRRAAERALAGNDLGAAIAHAERAVACGAEGEELGAARLVEAEAHRWRGEFAEAERCALAAMAVLPPAEARWFAAAGEAAIAAGPQGRGSELVHLAAVLAAPPSDGEAARARVVATARCAAHLLHAGQYDLAEQLITRLGEAGDDPTVAARIHQVHALRALFAGDPGSFLAMTERTAGCFSAVGDLRNACAQLGNLGYANLEVGAYEKAEAALRDALAMAEGLGLSSYAETARHNLGMALARLGRLDEARAAEARAVAAFAAQQHRRMEGAARLYLAAILLTAGEPEAAEGEARQAAELSAATPPQRAHALAVQARALLAQGRTAEATAAAEEAVSVIDSLGRVETGESLARLALVESLRAAGRREAAAAAAQRARDRLLERAAKITDRALRESFLTRVPENAGTLALAEVLARDARGG